MKQFISLISMAFACCATTFAQRADAFVIKGDVPGLKKGVSVSLLTDERGDKETVAETVVDQDGKFEIRGSVKEPIRCTLITNNLSLLNPDDKDYYEKIHWTYTPVFLDNVEMTIETPHYDSIPNVAVTKHFRIVGGEVQNDFTEYSESLSSGKYGAYGEFQDSLNFDFIASHPSSVLSNALANDMMINGYCLSLERIKWLEATLKPNPSAAARYEQFLSMSERAEKTATGSPLVDLDLVDEAGKRFQLVDVVPKGKIVLVDFWASWCGICIAANPTIREMCAKYPDTFAVVGISCDTKHDAWTRAMQKEKMSWPQYLLTEQGYKDFFYKYQLVGVPFFLVLGKDGKVVRNPGGIESVKKLVDELCTKN